MSKGPDQRRQEIEAKRARLEALRAERAERERLRRQERTGATPEVCSTTLSYRNHSQSWMVGWHTPAVELSSSSRECKQARTRQPRARCIGRDKLDDRVDTWYSHCPHINTNSWPPVSPVVWPCQSAKRSGIRGRLYTEFSEWRNRPRNKPVCPGGRLSSTFMY